MKEEIERQKLRGKKSGGRERENNLKNSYNRKTPMRATIISKAASQKKPL